MKLTYEQIQQAEQLHSAGVSWEICAAYLKTNKTTLTRYRKHYENKQE